ncbi:hypothetical protein Mgra_00005512 [Meloidogyne graminicola]|uniref:Uncharacterized protein n=1 Tax=Meloidogyne graminicola TaxID=189291 RepID=A0A8S9ZNR6_9BILA|nr:hypothetical protein Mgra_00005512 [Meloidogyne graminicola]
MNRPYDHAPSILTNNATGISTTTTMLGGSFASSQRRFAGHKISKVRFLNDQSEFTGRLVTGSWCTLSQQQQGYLTLWGANKDENLKSDRSFMPKERMPIGNGVDVNDIWYEIYLIIFKLLKLKSIVNAQQFLSSMSNGDVRIVNCPPNKRNDNENNDNEINEQQNNNQENKTKLMDTIAVYKNVHKQAASTTICLMDNEIFSGSETGQIVRIQPASRSTHAVRPFADDLMGVTHLRTCDQFLMLSAHSTGQIHLWDIRKRPQSPEFGIEPLNSRPVTGLNNSITAVAVHPTQLNVIGIGTYDGVVSFIDIRQSNEPLPIAFRVSQEPVTEIKFHPLYPNNCFSLSESSLIHWDGTMLSREINKTIYSSPNNVAMNEDCEAELLAMEMEEENDERRNIWLSARTSTSMKLRVLIEGEPRLLSTFDIELILEISKEMENPSPSSNEGILLKFSRKVKQLFPPFNNKSILKHYIPMSGIISHSIFTVNIFNPLMFKRLFPINNIAISNAILFNAHLGLGFYMFFRPHMHRLWRWRRVEYCVFSSGFFTKKVLAVCAVFSWTFFKLFLLFRARRYIHYNNNSPSPSI